MNRYLMIKDNIVINVTVWDGVSDWTHPEGVTLKLDQGGVGPGWTLKEDGSFEPPHVPEQVEVAQVVQDPQEVITE